MGGQEGIENSKHIRCCDGRYEVEGHRYEVKGTERTGV